jgi:hypothetical protein
LIQPPPAYIHEFPHPPAIVEFHPRKDEPFTLAQLDQALREGVRAVELDLRLRRSDGAVVCSHGNRDLAHRPTLGEALDAIRRLRGVSTTVRHDGLQFFVFLDLKDESPEFQHALMRVLAARAGCFANSAHADSGPRGITVIVTGYRAALERTVSQRGLDTLCVIEGREYDGERLADRSSVDRAPDADPETFQWTSVEYPVERSRVRAIHDGNDDRVRGVFNIRVVGARGNVARAMDSGADAVNADLDEIAGAVRHAERAAAPKSR